jgi:hypothetical protein
MRQDNYLLNRFERKENPGPIVQALMMLPLLYIGLSLITLFGD